MIAFGEFGGSVLVQAIKAKKLKRKKKESFIDHRDGRLWTTPRVYKSDITESKTEIYILREFSK